MLILMPKKGDSADASLNIYTYKHYKNKQSSIKF